MTVAKSAYTGKQSRYTRAIGVSQKTQEAILNKQKVVRDKEELTLKLNKDEHIHMDKIKKYFENVLNEQHFLDNYTKARQRILDGGGLTSTAQDTHFASGAQPRKPTDIAIAKKFMR